MRGGARRIGVGVLLCFSTACHAGDVILGVDREGKTDLRCFVDVASQRLTPVAASGALSVAQTPTHALVTSPPHSEVNGDCDHTYYEAVADNDPTSGTTRWSCSFACVPRDGGDTIYEQNSGPCAAVTNDANRCFHD